MNSKKQSTDDNNEITILLIDDNRVNNKLVASILMPQGYNIYIADSGLSGIKMIQDLKPDIILLDIMMPEIDGFQVCSHLQKDPLTSEIPIIFITADATVKTQTKAFQMGGSDFITKPIVDVVLIERIKNQVRLSRNKKKLQTLNNYYELAEEISNTGFWACRISPDNNDFTCSNQFIQLLNFPDCKTNEEASRSATDITALLKSSKDPMIRSEFAGRFKKCLTGGGFFDEVCNFRYNSKTKYLRVWARFTKESEECITGFGAVQDISQVINTENELAEIKAKIDEMSSKQHLVEANTQLAHEINQPLAAISLNINYIQQQLDSAPEEMIKIRDTLSDISKDVIRATNIVRNIRRIVKKEPVTSRKFDLRELLDDTIYIFNREIQQKNIELVFDRPAESCIINFARIGLQQVVVNLLKNAIEAILQANTKDPLIEVSTVTGKKETVIFVSDNGPGIKKSNQGKIFQQYFTSKKGNTGMGLAICKALMNELGGDICLAEPPEGRNTCFKVIVPN